MKTHKKIGLIIIAILLLGVLYISNPGGIVKGKRVVAYNLKSLRPEASLLSQYSGSFKPPEEQLRSRFQVYIAPWHIPNNNPTFDEKLKLKINIVESALPFFSSEFISLNTTRENEDYYWEAIKAPIISRGIVTVDNIQGFKQDPTQVYQLTIELPLDIHDKAWEMIRKGSYGFSEHIDPVRYVIPERYIIEKGLEQYVCLVTSKKDAWSPEARYYYIRGRLQKIVTDGTIVSSTYYDPNPQSYVLSGLQQGQAIVEPGVLSQCNK